MPIKKRPDILEGKTQKVKCGCGSLYLTLNKDKGELAEVRMNLGKSGTCVKGLLELISILYSIILQSDFSKDDVKGLIKKHCLGINCNEPFLYEGVKHSSCQDFVAKEILKELDIEEKAKT